MRIGIDMSLTAEAKTGLPSYARSLVGAMSRIDAENQYLLYPFVWHSFPLDHTRAFVPRSANFRRARRWMPKRLVRALWQRPGVDKDWLIGGDPDVYFSPFHSVPPRSFRRLVCVFHDIAFRIHPEFSTQVNIDHCESQFERARACADHMITVSHYSKQEMVEHMGVPADWITVTHEAADPMFRKRDDAQLPARLRAAIGGERPTILYVGSVEPRKNLPTLIKAFDRLHQRRRNDTVLVIAGGSGWKNSDVYDEIDRRGLADRVHFTGFVTDEELVALYNTCTVFVYPTIYEGFGLPVIEAMSCGAPVVTSRVTSIPEVGGDAVAYIDDPRDEVALSDRLAEVLDDAHLRADLRRRGLAQAATFSWERTARETLAVLEDVHRNPAYIRRRVEIGVDERGLHSGWHPAERGDGKWFRWSSRRATVRLHANSGELLVEAASSVPGGEQVLGVRVDGYLVGHAALTRDWREFRFQLDHRCPRDRLVEVALEVSFDLPRSIKGGDHRILGARVARIGFAPAASTNGRIR